MVTRRILFVLVLGVLVAGFRYIRTNTMSSGCDLGKDERVSCYQQRVESVIRQQGIDTALSLLPKWFADDPAFVKDCHGIAHTIGNGMERQYKKTKRFVYSQFSSYCSFGYYHGFMELFLRDGGSTDEARALCLALGEDPRIPPKAVGACFHGMGHGMADVHDPRVAGNERTLVSSALSFCDRFAKTRFEKKRCGTGVFDSLSSAYYGKENGFVIKRDDPLWICREQSGVYKESCYQDLMPAILWMGDQTLEKALPIVLTYAEESYKPLAITTLAEDSVRYTPPAVRGRLIPLCKTLPTGLVAACLRGVYGGVLQFGTPGSEWKEALDFCKHAQQDPVDYDLCMKTVVPAISDWYGKETTDEICGKIDSAYQDLCL